MATDHYQRLLQEIADLKRRSVSMRLGTVKEVQGDKLRISYGKNEKTGEEVLGPWVHQSNFRGEMRERTPFNPPEEGGDQGGGETSGSGGGGSGAGGNGQGGNQYKGGGQNVMMIMPNGDPAQAVILPYGPNKNNKPPDHANKSGRGETVSQMGEDRYSRGKDGLDLWLEPEEQQQSGGQQSAGGQSQQDDGKRKVGGDKATMKFRYNKETGLTSRVSTDVRSHVHKDGVKIKAKENFVMASKKDNVVVVKSSKDPLVNKPWKIGTKKDFDDDNA